MPDLTVLLIALGALAFNFITGFHDAANAIATSVLTRALSIPLAILMAAGLNLAGGLVHQAVAHTIGKGIVSQEFVTPQIVLAGLIGAIFWSLFTWYYGLPSSSTHAIVGGLMGAAGAAYSNVSLTDGTVAWRFAYGMYSAPGLGKVFLALVISPLAGFAGAWLFMLLLYHIFARTPPRRLNTPFRRLQLISAGFMAFSHGSNDAQNAMGIMTIALVSGGYLQTFHVPLWVRVLCATLIGLGTAAGGWRIIKTLGRRVMELQPIHGFAAETSAATVIQTLTFWGAPISTTHVISSAIMGVGASRRIGAVRWRVVGNILAAWVFTIPMSALVGALAYGLVRALHL